MNHGVLNQREIKSNFNLSHPPKFTHKIPKSYKEKNISSVPNIISIKIK